VSFNGTGTFLSSEKDWNGRMSGNDEPHTWSYGPRISEAAPHGFKHIAIQFLFGIIGVALITIAAIQFHLQEVPLPGVGPGTISLLYLIVIVFVSRRAGFVTSGAVSLIAVFCLNYFILPLVPSLEVKNPLDIVATVAFLTTAWVINASVTMEVQDEGQGMQQGALKRDSNPAALPGVGVAGMRERVRQLGGQLEIHSTPSGTTLKAVLPLS
jgi:hypothetical protein